MRAKQCYLVLLAVLFFTASTSSPVQAASWQEQMLNSLNTIRATQDLAPLILCRPLVTASQMYANSLAKQNFLDHKGKDGSTPGMRIQKAGYRWMNSKKSSSVSENIAAGQNSVKEVMKGWVKSKSHYNNMVGPELTHVGFGMAFNAKSTYKRYWVQNFGFGASC